MNFSSLFRKIFCLLAGLLLTGYGIPVSSAIIVQQYGSSLGYVSNFENDGLYCDVPPGFNRTRSTETAYQGERSLKIECSSQSAGILAITKEGTFSGKPENFFRTDLMAVLYVKGFQEWPSTLRMQYSYRDVEGHDITAPATGEFICTSADADGWHRVQMRIPPLSTNRKAEKISVQFIYEKQAGTEDGLTAIYLDDFDIKTIPVQISADDIHTGEQSIDLRDVRVYGMDYSGKRQEIVLKEQLEYKLLSGKAFLDGTNLRFYSSGETAEIQVSFNGCSDTFLVSFQEEQVIYTPITQVENTFQTTVTNQTMRDIHCTLMVCVFENQTLRVASTFTQTVAPGTAAEIRASKPELPFYISAPEWKAFFIYW